MSGEKKVVQSGCNLELEFGKTCRVSWHVERGDCDDFEPVRGRFRVSKFGQGTRAGAVWRTEPHAFRSESPLFQIAPLPALPGHGCAISFPRPAIALPSCPNAKHDLRRAMSHGSMTVGGLLTSQREKKSPSLWLVCWLRGYKQSTHGSSFPFATLPLLLFSFFPSVVATASCRAPR